jgi:lysophospholipase L1-like esterase
MTMAGPGAGDRSLGQTRCWTRRWLRRALVAVPTAVVLVALAPGAAAQTTERWEKEVAAYEAADAVTPPPRNEIVFVGSSSIRNWDLAASFPDLRVINRGVWAAGQGFELGDVVRFVDRLVVPHQPRIVVVYAGDNDISGGKTSEQVVVDAERLINRLRSKLPDVRIVFIGVKPSISRWLQVDRMRLTNTILRQVCERDDRVAYVDVDGPMMGWDERPRRELFVDDGLHLSAEGYRLWTTLVRPFLVPPIVASPPSTPSTSGSAAR